jgi:hypothetical protein
MAKSRLTCLWAAFLLIMAAGAAAAASSTVTVSAIVLSNSNCRFNSTSAALNFGAINPSSTADAIANATITFRCSGSAPLATFTVIHDSGLYETGPNANRMRHTTATTEFLPYALTLSPTTATVPKNTNQTLTITGRITELQYRDAYAGSYSDSVVLTLLP